MSSLRASDSDREQVAERLRLATTEGRLTPDELGERLEALYGSRTYGELDTLVADLPEPRTPRAPRRSGLPWWVGVAGATTLLLTVLGLLGAAASHHSVEAFPERSHRGPFALTGAAPEPHHIAISAASRVAVLGLLIVCGALAWLFIRSRDSSGG